MRSIRAFSLIELLIVISIAAILAATAVAQYRTYSVRAKISQAMVIFNNIGERSKAYYDANGIFPNLAQLGLYHDPGDPMQSPMAASLNDYTANYIAYSFLVDQGSTYTCPSVGYGGYISNLSEGNYITGNNSNASFIEVRLLLVNVKGVFQNYCQYSYLQYDQNSNTVTPVSGTYIPGCVNSADNPNSASFYDDAGNQC